jgi:alpha-L-fucosidase
MAQKIFWLVIYLVCFAVPAQSLSAAPDDERLNWWREARFGMFIHWGPVSLKGTEIGWSRKGERRDCNGTGYIPAEEYDALYAKFNPVKFDANEWVRIAQSAGMRYMVLVAKHHDGFSMFDSKLTEYKITNSPFKRDVCAELAKACRDANMPLGFYYSPPDWYHPDFFTENHDRYIKFLHGQVRELLTNYGKVDILWFDTDGGKNKPETWDAPRLIAMARELQPQILMTKRCAGLGDYDTPEQRVGAFQRQPWESCITICKQWSWKPDDKMKSLQECLRTLILCACGDGNLLFNVGPMPTGEIEPRQVERLKEMGQWLAKYGESIYGTRGGPFKPDKGKRFASTCKGNVIYVHIFSWPDEILKLPPIPAKILNSTVMTGGTVKVAQTSDGIEISVSPSERAAIDTIVVLTLDKPALSIAPLP